MGKETPGLAAINKVEDYPIPNDTSTQLLNQCLALRVSGEALTTELLKSNPIQLGVEKILQLTQHFQALKLYFAQHPAATPLEAKARQVYLEDWELEITRLKVTTLTDKYAEDSLEELAALERFLLTEGLFTERELSAAEIIPDTLSGNGFIGPKVEIYNEFRTHYAAESACITLDPTVRQENREARQFNVVDIYNHSLKIRAALIKISFESLASKADEMPSEKLNHQTERLATFMRDLNIDTLHGQSTITQIRAYSADGRPSPIENFPDAHRADYLGQVNQLQTEVTNQEIPPLSPAQTRHWQSFLETHGQVPEKSWAEQVFGTNNEAETANALETRLQAFEQREFEAMAAELQIDFTNLSHFMGDMDSAWKKLEGAGGLVDQLNTLLNRNLNQPAAQIGYDIGTSVLPEFMLEHTALAHVKQADYQSLKTRLEGMNYDGALYARFKALAERLADGEFTDLVKAKQHDKAEALLTEFRVLQQQYTDQFTKVVNLLTEYAHDTKLHSEFAEDAQTVMIALAGLVLASGFIMAYLLRSTLRVTIRLPRKGIGVTRRIGRR